ncbi:MAG: hypothetical protein PHV93_02090 [Candidatus Pacebacteria bacterium]|nr:hypothetical protein [Candidatus Paceibacterota bacterium]
MEQEILKKLQEQDVKIDAIYKSVEKTRKYIMWTAIITIAVIVLPLIGLVFVIPSYLSQLNSITNLQ